MKKLYALNILLFATLFYAGTHLNEEEMAFCAGLRPQGDNYEWASTAFAYWVVLCSLVSIFLSIKTFLASRIVAGLFLFLSLGSITYALVILFKTTAVTVQESLLVFGPYTVLGLLLNIYLILNAKFNSALQ